MRTKGYALCLVFNVSVHQVVLWDQDLAPITPSDPVGRIILAHLAELVPVFIFTIVRCAIWLRWRDGSKVLIPQNYLEYRDVEC